MRLIDKINQYILDPHIVTDRHRVSHYPSEASIISRTDGTVIGKCHRASYYSWMGEKPTNEIDARGMWTMNFGKKLEDMYTENFKQLGIWAGNNVKFFDPIHNVSGEADIFVFDEGQKIIGVEIKSAYGYGFQKKVTQFPKMENLLQVALYMKHFPYPWKLIYHSRDTMENVEYNITMANEEVNGKMMEFLYVNDIPVRVFYIEDIYTRFQQLGEYITKKILPPREYTYGYTLEQSVDRHSQGQISKTKLAQVKGKKATDSDWQCLYCSHLDRCWRDKRREILGS